MLGLGAATAGLIVTAGPTAPATAAGAVPAVSTTGRTLKGIGYGDVYASDVAKINSLKPDWWYNWYQTRKLATMSSIPAEFVPMLYSDNPDRLNTFADDIDKLKKEVPKTITAILGPNEPDWVRQDGTVQMTPLEVLNTWKYIQDNGFGLRKGSPATVSTSRIWLSQFMDAQKGLDQTKKSSERDFEVDFVAAHIYQQPHAGTWLAKVDDLYAKFNKPVWVTETCVHDYDATEDVPNVYSREEVNQFIKDIWEGAKARPWLERIAWHTRPISDPVGRSGALFNSNGTLTSTGVVWRDLV